jgi:hypothetical protein
MRAMPRTVRRSVPPALLPVLLALASFGPSAAPALAQQPWDLAGTVGGFGGSFQFADSLYLQRASIFGANAGIDLGRGVGLRGYYWQGFDSEASEEIGLRGYGGELQFDLTIFSTLKPFILGGYGRMDFEDDYEDQLGRVVADTDNFILGAGLAWDIARWLRLDVAARDYVFRQPRIDGEEIPDVRYNNLLVTGGVTFFFGRRKFSGTVDSSGDGGQQPTQVVVPAGLVVGGAAGAAVAGAGQDQAPVPTGLSEEMTNALVDPNVPTSTQAAQLTIAAVLAREIGYLDTKFPDQAQLGQPRGIIDGERADTLNDLLAPRLHEAFEYLALYEAGALLVELNTQLDQFNLSPDAKEEIMVRAQAILEQRVEAVRDDSGLYVAQTDSLIIWRRQEEEKRSRVGATLGGSFGNSGQVVLGGQLSFAMPGSPRWAIVPEAEIGVGGGGTSALVQVGTRYYFDTGSSQVYAGGALGLIVFDDKVGNRSGSSVILSPVVGWEVPSSGGVSWLGSGYQGWFVEYQGVDMFDIHRLLVGVNWGI